MKILLPHTLSGRVVLTILLVVLFGLLNHLAMETFGGNLICLLFTSAVIAVMVFSGLSAISARNYVKELESREAQLNVMFESASVGHLVISAADGKMSRANEKFCEMLGYSGAELQELCWEDITHPDDIKRTRLKYDELRDGNKKEAFIEKRYIRRNGAYVCALTYISLLKDQPESFYIVVIDDTERLRQEAELLESEGRFHAMADGAPVMIWISGLDASLVWVNHAWQMFTGRLGNEDLGTGWVEVIHPDDYRHALDSYWYHFQNKTPYQIECRLKKSNGEYRWTMCCGTPRFLPNGDFAGFIGTCLDITDLKHAEYNLRAYNDQLRGTVNARTEELQHAADEWEAFSHSIAHDMSSPLRVILGNCREVIQGRSGQLDEDGVENLQKISNAAQKMSHLIENLLQYAKLGNAKVKRQFINISQIAESNAEELSKEWPGATFTITPHLTDSADPDLVQICLFNFMENSCKYSRGNVHIEVGGFRENHKQVYFVRDNGVGFDQQYAHMVFKPFERLHNLDGVKGSGIGLANVNRIVNRHGGNCWVDSKVNEGSTFYFTLY